MTTLAGPHHFEHWQNGVVTHLQAAQKEFTIKETASQHEISFTWNDHTRAWLTVAEASATKPFNMESIKNGDTVRVLFRQSANRPLAKRVVVFSKE